jgi:hypothetical protein
MPRPVYGKRSRNLYDPTSSDPFKLSRSKVEMFTQCPRCFYIDRRLGLGRPSMPGFTLNTAVDHLLKKEFDMHRAAKSAHPLMEVYGIDAIPFTHEMMDEWRENFKGVQYHHEPTNFIITGAVDDIWVNPKNELIVVDYKATSTSSEITLESEYRQAYKRQMEIYQWLLRQNKFLVSNMSYFVYANGDKDKKAFDKKLEFNVQVISYEGDDGWVEGTINDMHECLAGNLPPLSNTCEHCLYRKEIQAIETQEEYSSEA